MRKWILFLVIVIVGFVTSAWKSSDWNTDPWGRDLPGWGTYSKVCTNVLKGSDSNPIVGADGENICYPS